MFSSFKTNFFHRIASKTIMMESKNFLRLPSLMFSNFSFKVVFTTLQLHHVALSSDDKYIFRNFQYRKIRKITAVRLKESSCTSLVKNCCVINNIRLSIQYFLQKLNVLNDFYYSLAVVTPFFSVSLIESVQSDIASESPVIILVLPFFSDDHIGIVAII